MAGEVSTVAAATRLGVSPSTVLNLLRAGRLAGRRGDQPRRPRWYVAVDDAGRPLGADGQPFRPAVEARDVQEQRVRNDVVSGRPGVAREVALRLKAAGERQRRALQLQAEAMNELAAALDEQGEAIAQLLLPDTVADLTSDIDDSRPS